MIEDRVQQLELENRRLQLQADGWRYTSYCLCASTLSFLVSVLVGTFHHVK
jgi:hypothetical protein